MCHTSHCAFAFTSCMMLSCSFFFCSFVLDLVSFSLSSLRLFALPVSMIRFTDKDDKDGNGGDENMVDETSHKPLMRPHIDSVASMNSSTMPIPQMFHDLKSSMAEGFQLIDAKLCVLTAQLKKNDDKVSKLEYVASLTR